MKGEKMIDTGRELQKAFDEGYAKGMEDATKRGRWVWDDRFHDYTCSECHNWDLKKPNYCSNCGAKMDLEE